MSSKDKDFNTIMGRVLKILTEAPEARDNDNLLAFIYWMKHCDKASAISNAHYILGSQHIMYGLHSFESIRRTRQKIQEGPNGRFKPSPDVVSARMRKQRQYLEWVRAQKGGQKEL